MKTTRQLRPRKATSSEIGPSDTKTTSKRQVLGDLSNRRSKRLLKEASKKASSDSNNVSKATDHSVERWKTRRGAAPLLQKETRRPSERQEAGKRGANPHQPRRVATRAVRRATRSLAGEKGPQDIVKRRSKGAKRSPKGNQDEPKPKRLRSSRIETKCSPRRNTKSREKKQKKTKHPELCGDFLPLTDYNLVRKPFDASLYSHGISTFDEHYQSDPQRVTAYATDLFQRLFHAETFYTPRCYMTEQCEINQTMREILVDWLVEVHLKFRLFPQTLYLCVNILDRYCGKVQVKRSQLQLVGVTSLLLACKYEEIYPPEIRDCVYMTDRAYTRQNVLDMEQNILACLEFRLTVPTGYPFLERFLLILEATILMKHAATYYMERSLQDYCFVRRRQSLVAAASVCLAINNPDIRDQEGLVGASPRVPKILLEYTGFKKQDILNVARDVADTVSHETHTNSRNLTAVKTKFENRKYSSVSRIVLNPDANDLVA